MINAGIFDGDQVLVRQQSSASNGDIVVALVEDSATVKTFTKKTAIIACSRRMIQWNRFLYMIISKFLVKYLVFFVYTNKKQEYIRLFSDILLFFAIYGLHIFLQLTYFKNSETSSSFPSLQILSRS